MRAGRLHYRIRIERRVVTKVAGLNSDRVTWETRYEHVPAGIEPLRAREVEQAAQTKGETTVRIVFYYLPGVVQTDRFVDEETGDVYEVVEPIDPNSRHRTLEVVCTRGMTDG